jgi:hypothetical protein
MFAHLMRFSLLPISCLLLLAGAGLSSRAAAAGSDATLTPAEKRARELQELSTSVGNLMQIGPSARQAAERDLARLEALRKDSASAKSPEVAQILLLEAGLCMDVLEDFDRSKAIGLQLESDFAGDPPAAAGVQLRTDAEQRRVDRQTQAALVGKPAPELKFVWSNKKGLGSLADLKGKVVVLVFWTTWHPRAVAGFDSLRDMVSRYEGTEVEFVGVTSVQGSMVGLKPQPIDFRGNPKGEMKAMASYVKAKRINWTVVFSEQPAFNRDYGVYRLPVMVIVAPDGMVRYIGQADETAKLTKIDLINAALVQAGRKVPGG